MLKTRYVFLPAILKIIKNNFPEFSLLGNIRKFNINEYKTLIKEFDVNSTNEKGKALENIVEYLINCSENLKLMGKRIHTGRDEKDISCSNISFESEFWKLGPLITIECKNWESKVGVEVIRQIGYIMSYKGNSATILITRNGLTSIASKEIVRFAMLGNYIIDINKLELESITVYEDFERLLISKYNYLIKQIESSIELLGI